MATHPIIAATSMFGQFTNYVTKRGDVLMDGDVELRFVSFNIPNLHYIEDNHAFNQVNPWRVADEFEIRDALTSIKHIGGKVTRTYVPSVRKEHDDPRIIRHVYGPGQFDEEAFKGYDKVLEMANNIGVRVIFPLLDNWWWWGGPKEYAGFRGKKTEDFWTDTLLIADFKKTVAHLVNRVNTITGVPYREDKAILCWETGNELEAPYSWTKEIAAYIKHLDKNHLVMEGTHSKVVSDEALADPNIDIVSTHHYGKVNETLERIAAARDKARGVKPYIVGEFGFIATDEMRSVIDAVITSGTSGIMAWSLRSHNRDGGFYYHTNAYRWPGFPSGDDYDESAVFRLFRDKAYEINRTQPEPLPPPLPPRILPIETPFKISWQGSTGASSYMIERRSDDQVWYPVIATNVSDANIGYRPLYSDTTVHVGLRYAYRLRARNDAGISEPSLPTELILVKFRMLIDEMADSALWFAHSGRMTFVPPKDVAKAKEDKTRLTGETGDYIVYAVPDKISAVQIDVFLTTPDAPVEIRVLSGPSLQTVEPLGLTKEVYEPFKNEYGAYTAVTYSAKFFPEDHRFIQVVLADGSQISRVELTYGEIP